jgi:hypothetical protein
MTVLLLLEMEGDEAIEDAVTPDESIVGVVEGNNGIRPFRHISPSSI